MDARVMLERVLATLGDMETLQARKVLELARRLKPGLTAEDIRNPHDFPDLEDPDWHFEDGQLAGIQAARFALASLASDLEGDGGQGEGKGEAGSGTAQGPEGDAVLPAVRGAVEAREGTRREGARREGEGEAGGGGGRQGA